MYDIEILTLYEYTMRMKAYRLSVVDKQYDMHLQAWLNHQVQATKGQGSKQLPVFKKFTDFFDYEKRIKEVEGNKRNAITPRMRKMARIAAKINGRR